MIEVFNDNGDSLFEEYQKIIKPLGGKCYRAVAKNLDAVIWLRGTLRTIEWCWEKDIPVVKFYFLVLALKS
jgi:hypothetical protein